MGNAKAGKFCGNFVLASAIGQVACVASRRNFRNAGGTAKTQNVGAHVLLSKSAVFVEPLARVPRSSYSAEAVENNEGIIRLH
jgi:hypothetical protein